MQTSTTEPKRPDGWVYVLTHPAWTSIGVVKIGMTSLDPVRRAAQITTVSGLIAPCSVHCCVYVANRKAAETAIHDYLRQYRVRRRRELFRVTPNFAASVLRWYGSNTPVIVARKAPKPRPRQRRWRRWINA